MEEGGSYLTIGAVLGTIAAIFTFIAGYIYCVAAYGFFLGVTLGWIPALILAWIVFYAVMFLWGIVLMGVAAVALFIAFHSSM